MRVLPRRFSRTAWVVVVNGLVLYGLVANSPSVRNSVVALALAAGILLEFAGSAAAALLNVLPFLYVPFGSVWERTHDAHFEDHPGEYSLTLALSAIPSLVVVAVNLFFYLPPLIRWRRGRGTMPS